MQVNATANFANGERCSTGKKIAKSFSGVKTRLGFGLVELGSVGPV